MFWRARNRIRRVHRDTQKMLLEDTIERLESKLAKFGDGFHLKARVKPKLLASLSQPANLVRSLGKFATFSVSVGSDSRRAYPGRRVPFAGGNSRDAALAEM